MRKRILIWLAGTLLWTASAHALTQSPTRWDFDPDQGVDVTAALEAAGQFQPPRVMKAADVIRQDPGSSQASMPIEWVRIEGTDVAPDPAWKNCGSGKGFCMGTDNEDDDQKPMHEVVIKSFEMSKTDVTVKQYAECVAQGQCTAPNTGDRCNWGKPDRENHPVNCVSWDQARAFAKFKGARLPTESEWEYAATSGGKNQFYPWGNSLATCERAVMFSNGSYGCGAGGTMPVCSKPAGNTAQGLCDMIGNVSQWLQDKYHDSYFGTPTDGSAYEGIESIRVTRGSSFYATEFSWLMQANFRGGSNPDNASNDVGFRLAR